jgi:hypothetical protein
MGTLYMLPVACYSVCALYNFYVPWFVQVSMGYFPLLLSFGIYASCVFCVPNSAVRMSGWWRSTFSRLLAQPHAQRVITELVSCAVTSLVIDRKLFRPKYCRIVRFLLERSRRNPSKTYRVSTVRSTVLEY